MPSIPNNPDVCFLQYADFGWDAKTTGWDTYGMYNKVLTIKALLDAGYAVVMPNAHKPGGTIELHSILLRRFTVHAGYWDTNQAYNTADLEKWHDSSG